MKDIKAVIFDLDGTLVDSMWVWDQIDIEFLTSKGHMVPNDLTDAITHLSFTETAKYFKDRFNITDSIENIMSTWNSMAKNHYANNVKLKNGALEFLTYLKAEGIKIGLATSNSIPLLEATLKNNNIYDIFDAITVTDEVQKSKSNPDVYLLAAKKLNVSPRECMVFEDILAAANGAKLAGMKVTAIYDESSAHQRESLEALCDKYILSYNDLLDELSSIQNASYRSR